MRRLRSLLIVFAAAVLLAGCGAFGGSGPPPRAEGQPIKVGLPTGVTSFANADVAVAIEKGFFSDVGLTVETQNLRSGVSSRASSAVPWRSAAPASSRL